MCIPSLMLSMPSMDLHIQLNKQKPVFSNHEAVSGQLVLCNAVPTQISGIIVTLRGTATTSLKEGCLAEHHGVCIWR